MRPNTRTANALQNGADGGREDIVETYGGSGATDDTRYVDDYALSVQDKADLGVRDDERVIYPARDEHWQGGRRFQQVRRRYGEARILRDKAGNDPCAHMTNHMVAVPKEAYEKIEAQRKRASKEYEAKFRPTGRGDEMELREELFEHSKENFRRRHAMNAEMFDSMGIGSNGMTAGMGLDEGLAYMERHGIDPEQVAKRARLGGQHDRNNRDAWKAAMRGDDGRKSTFTTGGAEFAPKVSPNSALGQVQQRKAREQAAASGKR